MTIQPLADLNHLMSELSQQGGPDLLAYCERAASLIVRLRRYLSTEDPAESDSLVQDLQAIQAVVLSSAPAQRLRAFFRIAAKHVEYVASRGACERMTAWGAHDLPDHIRDIPGMDGEDSLRYYHWLAQRLEYCGDIVEGGCWFGQSTSALAAGIVAGGCSLATKIPMIWAYDSFRWESWMANYVSISHYQKFGDLIPRQDGTDLLPAFRTFTLPFRECIRPYRVDMSLRDSENLDLSSTPIQLLVYDMGPDPNVLAKFWERFSHNLVPGCSWVVFNEYGSLRSSQIWEFCRGRADLVATHKPPGTLKSFRYCGQRSARSLS